VPQELGREPGQPALGVAHGGRRVVVQRAEVALPVDERVAHREGLREADERVVDGGVAVRVVVAHHGADDARALLVRPVRLHAVLVHAVEDVPVHRLEAVAHVRQRARDDHRHRVVEEARAHLLLELARLDAAGAERLADHLRHRGSAPPSRLARGNPWFPREPPPSARPARAHTSRKRTSFAFCSMNSRRGSTWSPISIEKTWSAAAASSTSTCSSMRRAGSIVVSHSCSGFISPRPLKREICIPSLARSSERSRSAPNVSAVADFLPYEIAKGGRPTTSAARAYALRSAW